MPRDANLKRKPACATFYIEQLYTFGDPDRDPRTRVISVAYFALVRADRQRLRVSEESLDVRWFPVRAAPSPLAFDHDRILATALARLRSKTGVYDTGVRIAARSLLDSGTETHLRTDFR